MRAVALVLILALPVTAAARPFGDAPNGTPLSGTASGAIDLAGFNLYMSGAADLNGFLKYYSTNGRRLAFGIPYNLDGGNPRLNIGVGPNDGVEANMSGGFSIGPQADIVIMGNASNGTNINTYGSDTKLALGAGVSTVRGDSFLLYNSARLAAVTDEMKASANEQNFLHSAFTVNQTGTAAWNGFYLEWHETSHGSGKRRPISIGVNANTSTGMVSTAVRDGTDNTNYTPVLTVDTDGNVATAAAAKLGWTTYSSGGAQSDITQLTAPADGVLAVNIGAGTASSTLPSILLGANASTGVRLRRTGNGTAELDNGDASASGSLTVGSFVADSSGTTTINSGAGINLRSQAFFDSPSSNNAEVLNAAGNGYGGLYAEHYSGNGLLTSVGSSLANNASMRYGVNRLTVTHATIVACGASTTCDITWGTIPADSEVVYGACKVDGQEGTLATLTASVGKTAAGYVDYIPASSIKAAANTIYGDAKAELGASLYDGATEIRSYEPSAVVVKTHLIGSANLSGSTVAAFHCWLDVEALP